MGMNDALTTDQGQSVAKRITAVLLDAPDGADRVIGLFRLSYERAARAAGKLARTPSDV